MKDWKTYVVILGILFLVKMCGGGNGCSGGDVNKDALKAAIERRTGKEVRHINSVEKVNDDPLTYKFVFEWNMGGIRERQSGFVYLYDDGTVDKIRFLNDATVVGAD